MKAVQVRTISIMMAALLALAGIAAAQEAKIEPGSERPMFTRLPATLHNPRNAIEAASTPLQTWNGSFSFSGTTYNYNMVGTAPSTGASTTVQVEIIPIKIVTSGRGGVQSTFDPSHVLSNGKTVTANTVASPIFASIPFSSGGVNIGTTQYVDAYQRANFWGTVQSHTGYHVLLGQTVLAQQTLSPPKR